MTAVSNASLHHQLLYSMPTQAYMQLMQSTKVLNEKRPPQILTNKFF